MKTSPNGLTVMHYFEQCRLEAYPDPGSKDGKPWTIGWGHTGPEVVKGLKWTQSQADAALVEDLSDVEKSIMGLVKVSLSQGQFDALASFTYNLGRGNLASSTLLKVINAQDYAQAPAQFARWNKNDGKVMRGLTRRRAAESALWVGHNGADSIKLGVAAA